LHFFADFFAEAFGGSARLDLQFLTDARDLFGISVDPILEVLNLSLEFLSPRLEFPNPRPDIALHQGELLLARPRRRNSITMSRTVLNVRFAP
jgi:hypothetical protein